MAYMCADSGNLMAIAQQVIQQQKQQQQQRQQQQQQQQQQQLVAASVNPFSTNPTVGLLAPAPAAHDRPLPFVIPDLPPSPFAPIRRRLRRAPWWRPPRPWPFRLSDFGSSASAVAAEFDSDEWMESLIGDSPAESSDLMGDPWQGAAGGSGALFADAFPSCSTDFSPPSPPASASDLNHVLFSEHCEIAPLCTGPAPSQTAARLVAASLESLLDCARIADSDPDLAAKSLIHVRESASSRAIRRNASPLLRRSSLPSPPWSSGRSHSYPSTAAAPPSCSSSSFDSSPETSPSATRPSMRAPTQVRPPHREPGDLEATESAARIHIVDFGIMQESSGRTPPGLNPPAGSPPGPISGIPAPALEPPPPRLAATGNRLRDSLRSSTWTSSSILSSPHLGALRVHLPGRPERRRWRSTSCSSSATSSATRPSRWSASSGCQVARPRV
ncbi:unnamed protein product [Musa acuminata subsp. burmannicoides]